MYRPLLSGQGTFVIIKALIELLDCGVDELR